MSVSGCCCCYVTSVMSDTVRPHRRQPTRLPVPGILQARTLESVAISFSNAWKWKVKVKLLSRVQLFSIPWTATYQAPPSMGFSKQEYWSGVPLPSLVSFRNHCLIMLGMFIMSFIHPLQNIFSCYDTSLSGAIIIIFSVISPGNDFSHALWKCIYCPFSCAFPSIPALQNPAAVYKRRDSFDKDNQDDEWNLIYATFM